MRLPAETLRLFSGYDEGELIRRRHRGFLIGQILERGDSEDLRWLFGNVRSRHITQFVEQQGQRKLTRRNLVFWNLLAELADDYDCTSADLWPH